MNKRKHYKTQALKTGMAIASHLFSQKIASTYRIETQKNIASVIASQNYKKIICDYFDFLINFYGTLFGCELQLFRHNYVSGERKV